VFGSSGFIGSHLVRRLKVEGYWVRGVDLNRPSAPDDIADDLVVGDLRTQEVAEHAIDGRVDELYQLAADMGGAGYIFSGHNDANLMRNSALINLHAAECARRRQVGKVFYSSSACIYPRHNQAEPSAPDCREDSAYPADPDSEYGWEKLFSERMYQAFRKNHQLDVRIARLHNVYGPRNPWCGGKEKAPAALCRKVAEADANGAIDIWGDGRQTRSFLYVDDCVNGIRALMASACAGPVNIGSEELISIDDFARLIMRVAAKSLAIRHVPGPVGVRGRRSDNRLMWDATGWRPGTSLEEGITRTYQWVAAEVSAQRNVEVYPSLDRV
jgi:nucleoside-diphosphate-sugar epimerase